MSITHPFLEKMAKVLEFGWISFLKEELLKVVDWNLIDNKDYLSSMERSPINDLEIRYLILTL